MLTILLIKKFFKARKHKKDIVAINPWVHDLNKDYSLGGKNVDKYAWFVLIR